MILLCDVCAIDRGLSKSPKLVNRQIGKCYDCKTNAWCYEAPYDAPPAIVYKTVDRKLRTSSDKPLSERAQYARNWFAARVAKGLCCQCGREPLHPQSKSLGDKCLVRLRIANRKSSLHSPWRPGSPGHPPFQTASKEEA